jgi:hypothetical protein
MTNPGKAGSAFKRCVASVSAKGTAYSPSGVCATAGRKKYGAKKFQEMAAAGKKRAAKKHKPNPAAEAIQASTDFHGRPPDKTINVSTTVHFHRHLAGAGKLEKLKIDAPNGDRVTLSGFKGALLAFNEKRNQLFIQGGDQEVDLKQFGIRTQHETEVLGNVKSVEYFTTKDHLGREGGTATYVHKFEKPLPLLLYRVRDKQLEFAGGGYTIPDEGIDR